MSVMEAEIAEETGASASGGTSPGVPNHWIVLDGAWARRLGVRREGGVYRIRSQELARRLAVLRSSSIPDARGPALSEIACVLAVQPAMGARDQHGRDEPVHVAA